MQKQPTDGVLEEFRLEFLECWRQLPNKGLFLVLLAVWFGLFQFLGNSTLGYVHSSSLLRWMYDVYRPSVATADADESHALVVPLVVLGILWWKRKDLVALPLRAWWPGMGLLALALGCHMLGYMIQMPAVSIMALFMGIYALAGLAWGPAWLRATFFPFVLFVFCVPGLLSQSITFPLRMLVCRLTEFVSGYILQIDIVREGTALRDPTNHYQYEVAAACSGMRSLVATILVATTYGMLSFRPWWKRAVLIGSAFPLAVFGNLVRMLTIVIAAEMGGQEWGNWVHEGGPMGIFSLLPYVPAFGGLYLLGYWLRERKPEHALPLGLAPITS